LLELRDVAEYLLKCGLISARQITEGDLEVVDASQRNNNFKVVSERGPSYLLKQGVGTDKVATVANEAAVYAALHADATNAGMGRYLPRLCRYDENEHILVLELLPQAETLLDRHYRLGTFSTMRAATVGKALGTLHRTGPPEWRAEMSAHPSSNRPHWILSIQHPTLEEVWQASSANIQVMRIIQRFPEFCRLLNELRDEWHEHGQALVHGDIKWSNIITFAPGGSKRKTGTGIVDWELARIGDPCWDTGSAFSDYLSFWLLSIPVTGEEPPDRFLELAKYPIEKMHPAIRAFWDAYRRTMALDPTQSEDWLLRSVRYAAARLVQTAYEQVQETDQLTGNAVSLLQLSFNIMQRPAAAAMRLLGIPTTRAWAA
jgi:hypothetical protein